MPDEFQEVSTLADPELSLAQHYRQQRYPLPLHTLAFLTRAARLIPRTICISPACRYSRLRSPFFTRTMASTSETQWTAQKVRETYMQHFTQDGQHPHTFVPSSSVIPWDDPTLLFTNSGMGEQEQLDNMEI